MSTNLTGIAEPALRAIVLLDTGEMNPPNPYTTECARGVCAGGMAQAPEARVSFFARRSGALPRMAAQIAGIRLPKGARRPPIAPAYWISDEPSDDAVSVAGWLAEEFSRTGVWPLLWLYDKDPDAYMDQPGNPDHTDGISVQNVLHALGRSSIELLTASSFRRRCCHSRKLTTTLAF